MPISLLEEMSYGCCCLTSDIPECTEVCGENAVYFKSGDEADLKEKLEALLSDGETVSRLKAVSQSFVLENFSWKDVCEKTLELYKKE